MDESVWRNGMVVVMDIFVYKCVCWFSYWLIDKSQKRKKFSKKNIEGYGWMDDDYDMFIHQCDLVKAKNVFFFIQK